MFHYVPTPLEEQITQLYRHLDIHEPYELDMLDIASKLNIWIYFKEMDSQALNIAGKHYMVIDKFP